MASIHSRLRSIRKELGYTQERIGEICGIKKSAYSMIETGRSHLSTRNFEILTDVLSINKEWLMYGTGEMFSLGQYAPFPIQDKTKQIYISVPVYDINTINSNGNNSMSNILRYLPFCSAKIEDIAVVVSDSSMTPIIANNSVVLLRRCIGFDAIFNNNKPHLIILKDGRRYIRNLSINEGSTKLLIFSATNKDYEDVVIEKSRITAIYKIMAVYYDSSY